MDQVTLPTAQLVEWETNKRLRAITEENYEKLKGKLELKPQFKPLIVTPDNTPDIFITLAGNHRLKVYKDLGIQDIWVKVVTFEQDNQGLWFAVLEEKPLPEKFQTKEDAMLDWSMVDNEEAAYYDREMFINEMDQYNLDWSNYAIGFESPLSIPATLHKFGIHEQTEEDIDAASAPQYSVVIDCQNDIEQKEYLEKVQSLGMNAKAVTK